MTTPEALAEVVRRMSEWVSWREAVAAGTEVMIPPAQRGAIRHSDVKAVLAHLGERREQESECICRETAWTPTPCPIHGFEGPRSRAVGIHTVANRWRVGYLPYRKPMGVRIDELIAEKKELLEKMAAMEEQGRAQAAAHGEDVRRIQVRMLAMERVVEAARKRLHLNQGAPHGYQEGRMVGCSLCEYLAAFDALAEIGSPPSAEGAPE